MYSREGLSTRPRRCLPSPPPPSSPPRRPRRLHPLLLLSFSALTTAALASTLAATALAATALAATALGGCTNTHPSRFQVRHCPSPPPDLSCGGCAPTSSLSSPDSGALVTQALLARSGARTLESRLALERTRTPLHSAARPHSAVLTALAPPSCSRAAPSAPHSAVSPPSSVGVCATQALPAGRADSGRALDPAPVGAAAARPRRRPRARPRRHAAAPRRPRPRRRRADDGRAGEITRDYPRLPEITRDYPLMMVAQAGGGGVGRDACPRPFLDRS